MKIAEYVVQILLRKHRKFGEKIYYHFRDINFFLGVTFLAHPVFITQPFICGPLVFNIFIIVFVDCWKLNER